MLILSRRSHEGIRLVLPPGTVLPPEGLELEVLLLKIPHRNGCARIGVTAPPYVAIHRYEVPKNPGA